MYLPDLKEWSTAYKQRDTSVPRRHPFCSLQMYSFSRSETTPVNDGMENTTMITEIEATGVQLKPETYIAIRRPPSQLHYVTASTIIIINSDRYRRLRRKK